jgi:hypothetical protein
VTRQLILNPNRPEYTGGKNWLGHGARGGKDAVIDYLLLDGATMERLLQERNTEASIRSHFQSLNTDHDLPVTRGTDGRYRFDRDHLRVTSSRPSAVEVSTVAPAPAAPSGLPSPGSKATHRSDGAQLVQYFDNSLHRTGFPDLRPEDFDPTLAVRAFGKALKLVQEWFVTYDAGRTLPADEMRAQVESQIFKHQTMKTPLYRLFCMEAVNRSGGVPLNDEQWDVLAPVLCSYSHRDVARRYSGFQALCDAILCADEVTRNHLIRGERERHRRALGAATKNKKNSWVRFARAAWHGASLFSQVEGPRALTDMELLEELWGGVPLHRIPLQQLTLHDLQKATELLAGLPEFRRQLALNLFKDFGIANALKPDVHVRKIAGMAFGERTVEYPPNEEGEWACVRACLAFAQVLSVHGHYPEPGISLAAVDRLLWLAGSGRLWSLSPTHRLPRSDAEERRKTVATILREGIRVRR